MDPTPLPPLRAAADKSQERRRSVIGKNELGDGDASHLAEELRGAPVHRLGHDSGVAHNLDTREGIRNMDISDGK